MYLPTLNEIKTTRDMVSVFGGYNHNLRIKDGEFFEMTNLSSSDYPTLSPRKKRSKYLGAEDDTSGRRFLFTKNEALYYVSSDGSVYKGGEKLSDINVPENTTQIVTMGTYIICFPLGRYYNLSNSDDNGFIGISVSDEMVFAPSGEYIKITTSAQGRFGTIKQGDMIRFDNINDAALYEILRGVKTVENKVGDSIYIRGELKESVTLPNPELSETDKKYPQIYREFPEMDYVIESGNRLWGCRYGKNKKGEFVNEIYASRLGDFKHWDIYKGVSTDSYAVSLGSDGEFTGAVNYMGNPVFFKENYIHKVYGQYPSNFQVQTTSARGVQKGCSGSVAILSERVVYKSKSGVCVYDGSLPVDISEAFGEKTYSRASAGILGNKYYISMMDDDTIEGENYSLFVYDAAKGMWHREDDTEAVSFCTHNGNLYYIDKADNQIYTVMPLKANNAVDEMNPVEWEAVTGILGTDTPDKKYISTITVRMRFDVGAEVRIWAEYDSCGSYDLLCYKRGTSLESISIPVKPRRCDHLRLKFKGKGDVKIFSIAKTIEQGSDY